jgi:hypothetical protein
MSVLRARSQLSGKKSLPPVATLQYVRLIPTGLQLWLMTMLEAVVRVPRRHASSPPIGGVPAFVKDRPRAPRATKKEV